MKTLEQMAKLRRRFEPLVGTLDYFTSLPEYSATVPTGTTIGKRWRRHDGSFDQAFMRAGGMPCWQVCEYIDINDPKNVGIKRYRPVIRVKAGRAP